MKPERASPSKPKDSLAEGPTTMRSHYLSLFTVLLVLALANAAPHAAAQLEQSHRLESRTLGHIWSALELWLYRLTHGGQYPPGYGQTPGVSTSTTVAQPSRTSSVAGSSSSVVISITSASSSIESPTIAASSSSSSVPTVAVPVPTSTSTSKGFLYAKQTVGDVIEGCIISDGNWYIGGEQSKFPPFPLPRFL